MYSSKDPSFRALFRRSIILPVGLTALLLAVLTWLITFTNSQSQSVQHSYAVIAQTEGLLTHLVDAETGLRGFELTKDTDFLEPYWKSRTQIPADFRDLREMLQDEPLQLAWLKELQSNYDQWIKIHGDPAKRPPGLSQAFVGLSMKRLMDNMRGVVARIERGENAILSEASAKQKSTAYTLVVVLGGSATIFAVVLSYQSVQTIKALSGRYESALTLVQHQADELRASRDELDKRVEERTRELNAVNRELEIFCYSAAHDLRGPLRWIIGTNRLFMEDYGKLVPEEGIQDLERVNASAIRLSKLIDSLLEMARLGKAEINKVTVDLSALCSQTVTEIQARDWGGPVKVEIQPNLSVEGDPILVSMLIQNLLENAFKFCGQTGEGKVKVTGHRENGHMVFSVQDNGVGFDSSHSGKLFQPFERLHKDEEFAGTGMGLANARRIVERHGGKIWAEGKPGHGATFSFSLPVED